MPAPQLSPTGTLNPNLSQSFGGIPSGGNPPPWMPQAPVATYPPTLGSNPQNAFSGVPSGGSMPPWMMPQQPGALFQNGMGGAIPQGIQAPLGSSGDMNGTIGQIPGYGNSSPQAFGQFQNFIPQAPQNPYGGLGGGSLPVSNGGYWNQIAQQMAGPMFGPYGASALMGNPNPLPGAQPSPLLQPSAPPSSTAPSALGYNPTQLPGAQTAPTGALPVASPLGSLGVFSGSGSPFSSTAFQNPMLAQKLGMLQQQFGTTSRLPIMRY